MRHQVFLERRAIGAALIAAWIAAGCVVPTSTSGGGSGGGGEGGASGEGGGAGFQGTDAEVCDKACGAMIECGVELDLSGCKLSCTDPAGPPLVACLRQSTVSCDPIAQCFWGAVCGAQGVPAGSASCVAVEECAINCAGSNDSAVCGCLCAGQAAPGAAAAFYAVTVCSVLHCNGECGELGDPGYCQGCLANACVNSYSQCK